VRWNDEELGIGWKQITSKRSPGVSLINSKVLIPRLRNDRK